MRRPEIELADDVARYVEQHPEVIALLAGRASVPGGSIESPAMTERRARFRAHVRRQVTFAGTEEAAAAGAGFLARFGSAL
jgi:hypothetical protein